MGLKMPSDEDILANKIFLNRASVRNKAKSWLDVSSGLPNEQASSSLSKTSQETAENDLSTLRASDELSGIGVATRGGEDDPSNRQLMSANDALRRKLLSRDAYKRYSVGKKPGTDASRPVTQKRELEEDDDYEEESKGRSVRKVAVLSSSKGIGQDADDSTSTKVKTPDLLIKKRPAGPNTYLDQLLMNRGQKRMQQQQKKAKKSDSND